MTNRSRFKRSNASIPILILLCCSRPESGHKSSSLNIRNGTVEMRFVLVRRVIDNKKQSSSKVRVRGHKPFLCVQPNSWKPAHQHPLPERLCIFIYLLICLEKYSSTCPDHDEEFMSLLICTFKREKKAGRLINTWTANTAISSPLDTLLRTSLYASVVCYRTKKCSEALPEWPTDAINWQHSHFLSSIS